MERQSQLESQWTQVNGLPIHARVSAQPGLLAGVPELVLVHGLVISSRYMVPVAERLAPNYRIFAPDMPGFGKSGKPAKVLAVSELAEALVAWMDAIHLERALFLGNSFGCQVIVEAAVRYSSRVAGAILTAPSMDPHARTPATQFIRWLRDWPLEEPSVARHHLIDFWRAGLWRSLKTFFYALEDRIEEKLPQMRIPTLVVRGARDPIVPQYWAEEAADLLPLGRLVVIPGGPHCLNYSTPDQLAEIVSQFVADEWPKEVRTKTPKRAED